MLLKDFCTQLKAILGITENKTIAEMTVEIPTASSSPITASLIDRTVKNYTIPNGVTSIGDYAFANCTSLTSITIPNSVTSMGNYAFFHCTSLPSITIPDSVTSIGDYAFFYCTSLTSITIPNGVTSIRTGAFSECTIHFRFRCSESEVPSGYPWGADNATAEYNYTGA